MPLRPERVAVDIRLRGGGSKCILSNAGIVGGPNETPEMDGESQKLAAMVGALLLRHERSRQRADQLTAALDVKHTRHGATAFTITFAFGRLPMRAIAMATKRYFATLGC